jgi:hypothetical protein
MAHRPLSACPECKKKDETIWKLMKLTTIELGKMKDQLEAAESRGTGAAIALAKARIKQTKGAKSRADKASRRRSVIAEHLANGEKDWQRIHDYIKSQDESLLWKNARERKLITVYTMKRDYEDSLGNSYSPGE